MIVLAARITGSLVRTGFVAAATCAAALVIGCSASPTAPEIRAGVFAGPVLSLVEHEDHHAVVMRADRPGWTIRLDRVEERFGFDRIYVTLRRPHPLAPSASLDLDQRVLTRVLVSREVEVYARELDHDAALLAEDSYALAVGRSSKP